MENRMIQSPTVNITFSELMHMSSQTQNEGFPFESDLNFIQLI